MLVYRNALRLQRMVNTLLEFSRVESGHARPVFEVVDLARLTNDIASTFRTTIEQAGLCFTLECELQDPVCVSREMWEKVVLNLLSNAFKFTFSGGIALRLEEASRQKDRFLAILGHELCSPLAPLLHSVDYLQSLQLRDERASRAIATIQRQTSHVTRRVDALLDIGRVTKGSTELKREVVDLGALIQSAIEGVDLLFFSRRHRLTVQMHNGDLLVHGDALRLMECLANLLTNAAKYTGEGGHIELRVRKDSGFAVVEVVDEGSGISAELLPQVFELYAQDRRAPEGAEGGFGVGLAVVRLIARLHGGEGFGSQHRRRPRIDLLAAPAAGRPGPCAAGGRWRRMRLTAGRTPPRRGQ
jgi:signal transduction histidine kinase